MKKYDNVVIFDHPLIKHKIAILRDEKNGNETVPRAGRGNNDPYDLRKS